jgi:hypothetical protein
MPAGKRLTRRGVMSIRSDKTKRFAAGNIFPLFVCAVLGLALSQVGAVQMQGSWGVHVLLGLPGLVLSALALFRARLHWAAAFDMPSVQPRTLGSCLLLLATGVCIGALITVGSVTLVGVIAALSYMLPWARILPGRFRFMWSSVVVIAGAITWVVAIPVPGQSMYLMIAGWMLYLPSMFMYIFVLLSLDYGYRIGELRQ